MIMSLPYFFFFLQGTNIIKKQGIAEKNEISLLDKVKLEQEEENQNKAQIQNQEGWSSTKCRYPQENPSRSHS